MHKNKYRISEVVMVTLIRIGSHMDLETEQLKVYGVIIVVIL